MGFEDFINIWIVLRTLGSACPEDVIQYDNLQFLHVHLICENINGQANGFPKGSPKAAVDPEL